MCRRFQPHKATTLPLPVEMIVQTSRLLSGVSNRRVLRLGAACLLAVALASSLTGGRVLAQRTRFPSGQATPVQPAVSSGGPEIPQTNLVPISPPSRPPTMINPQTPIGPGSQIRAPVPADPYATTNPYGVPGGQNPPGTSTLFDPYSRNAPGASLSPPTQPPVGPPPAIPGATPNDYPNGSLLGRVFSGPASAQVGPGYANPGPGYANPGPGYTNPGPGYGAPAYAPPAYAPAAPPVSPYGSPAYPSTIYPSPSPSTLFPGGLIAGGSYLNWGSPDNFSAYRLLQGPRLRHTYLAGGDEDDSLGINRTDVSVAFAFPNFLYSGQPIYVVPSFSLYLWDGPVSGGGPDSADLPPSAYGAYMDFGWETDPNRIFGAELGLRVGAFSDFDTFSSDSIRVLGKGLLSFRLTPASTLKGGVYYVDRVDVQLIPAGGVLWQPNPSTRFDIFFPEPKFAHYWRTIGTKDVWWYLAGGYGVGAWTIERTDETTDSVAINDLRAVFGFEWGPGELLRTGRRTAFVEAGYVFQREVEYENSPSDDFTPDNTWMIRAGIGY